MQPKVTVVLVNYNGGKYLTDCISSIKEQTYQNLEIVLIDNHSTDNSLKLLHTQFPEVYVKSLKENTGFARGNNIGISIAIKNGADYVLLLNVDTVSDTMLVEKLVKYSDDNTVTTARICMDKGLKKNWYAGGFMDFCRGKSVHREKRGQCAEPEKVSFICGCCMLIHKNILDRVGTFDEKYYLYYEDTDLCMRFLKNHIQMLYIPDTWIWHRVGGSSSRNHNPMKEYYFIRNQLYFINKFSSDMKINRISAIRSIFIDHVLLQAGAFQKFALLGIKDFFFHHMYAGKYNFKT